jgi:hypothetical protein
MKGLFPEYEDRSRVDHDGMWNDALFIFDSSVLLNLYRYRPSTREQLLNVLSGISTKIWLAHHSALEFQCNRLPVISAQTKGVVEVRKIVAGAKDGLAAEFDRLRREQRHSLVNPLGFAAEFDKLANAFLAELEQLENAQQNLAVADPLKQRIEHLFDGRVGEAPASQADVDALYEEAQARYAARIPPGYADAMKFDTEQVHAGIRYKRKYADFLVWSQILAHCRQAGVRTVVYVTADMKADWWQTIEGKRLGARPELVEEARRRGGVENFSMYEPEAFLGFANEALSATVPREALDEVREVSMQEEVWRNRF